MKNKNYLYVETYTNTYWRFICNVKKKSIFVTGERVANYDISNRRLFKSGKQSTLGILQCK